MINVGSGQATSVRELVDLVAAVTVRRLEPLSRPSESIGVSAMQADLTLARQRLGFTPKVQLAEGLRRTFERDPRFSQKAPTPTAGTRATT